MACQSAVRKKVPTSLGKLRPPGTPVRVTRSVSRPRSERVDSEEADVRGEKRAEDVRCEERTEVVLSRTEAGRTETVKHQVLTTSERGKTAPVSDKAASGIPGPSQDQVGEVTETVRCGCGVNEDDGEPLLQCEECEVWSHTACAGVTISEAQIMKLIYSHFVYSHFVYWHFCTVSSIPILSTPISSTFAFQNILLSECRK